MNANGDDDNGDDGEDDDDGDDGDDRDDDDENKMVLPVLVDANGENGLTDCFLWH